MIREPLEQQLDHDPHFTWRGDNVTRVENLSDIVFALSLGMLVSARTSMNSYTELLEHLLNIVPVIAGFAIMLLIWNAHFVYFRRYGVADSTIIFLNAFLLLLVLFIAYPLRFIFDSLFFFIIAVMGFPERIIEMGVGYEQSGEILAIFSAGYAVVFFVLMLMYSHAGKNAEQLSLSAAELIITRQSIWVFRCQVLVALLVLALALFSPLRGFAGMLYSFMWPLSMLVHARLKLPEETQQA
ncbi:MAG: TMEM175 family protein [Aquisalinus sp.]|nr:TMEM175 family protein [Aquisalinus sp.]